MALQTGGPDASKNSLLIHGWNFSNIALDSEVYMVTDEIKSAIIVGDLNDHDGKAETI